MRRIARLQMERQKVHSIGVDQPPVNTHINVSAPEYIDLRAMFEDSQTEVDWATLQYIEKKKKKIENRICTI